VPGPNARIQRNIDTIGQHISQREHERKATASHSRHLAARRQITHHSQRRHSRTGPGCWSASHALSLWCVRLHPLLVDVSSSPLCIGPQHSGTGVARLGMAVWRGMTNMCGFITIPFHQPATPSCLSRSESHACHFHHTSTTGCQPPGYHLLPLQISELLPTTSYIIWPSVAAMLHNCMYHLRRMFWAQEVVVCIFNERKLMILD
jgi:hypothetical protein